MTWMKIQFLPVNLPKKKKKSYSKAQGADLHRNKGRVIHYKRNTENQMCTSTDNKNVQGLLHNFVGPPSKHFRAGGHV
jgi:hypothetical protein